MYIGSASTVFKEETAFLVSALLFKQQIHAWVFIYSRSTLLVNNIGSKFGVSRQC